MVKIARAFVKPTEDVNGPSVFLEEGSIAKALLRLVARFLGRHSGGEDVGHAHFQMRAQLFVKFLIQPISLQQASQARDPGHDVPTFLTLQANSRTWATASMRRSQFFSSSRSWLRPWEIGRAHV